MRTQINFVIGGLFGLAFIGVASAVDAQSLQRPVNAQPTGELSIGALASQVNPGRNAPGASTQVFTNADLKLRPAPVIPTTPAFPEIAPARGILEHPGAPEIGIEFEPMPQGIPVWDLAPGGFFGPFPGQGRNRRGRLVKPGEDLHDRFGIFTPGFGLRSGALGPPLGAGRDLFKVNSQRSSKGHSGKGGKKQ